MDMRYVWKFTVSEHNISIQMDCIRQGRLCFMASLALIRQQPAGQLVDKQAFSQAFLTMKIVALIYFQALKLWVKKVPFFEHPDPQRRKGW